MTAYFDRKYAANLRLELAEIERCLRVRTEDVARLETEKTEVESNLRKLRKIEGERTLDN